MSYLLEYTCLSSDRPDIERNRNRKYAAIKTIIMIMGLESQPNVYNQNRLTDKLVFCSKVTFDFKSSLKILGHHCYDLMTHESCNMTITFHDGLQ